MKVFKFLYVDTSMIVYKIVVLTVARGRREKKGRREKGERRRKSLKSIALGNSAWDISPTECPTDLCEGGLLSSNLSQNFAKVHRSIWEQNGFALLEGWWINVIINSYKDSIESFILLRHTFLKGRLFKMKIPYLKGSKSFTFHFAFLDALHLFSS